MSGLEVTKQVCELRTINIFTSLFAFACAHQLNIKTFLSSDPVLKILKPKLIGKIQGPISAPAKASNTLEGTNGIVQLLREV